MAGTSIAATLGTGSGIDTKTLVAQLVAAQKEPKTTQITTQTTKVTAQISGISQLKSGLTNFSTSLQTLIKGGTLSTAPSSSDSTTVKATLTAGAHVDALSSTVKVKQLASQQTIAYTGVASSDAPVGLGTLSFSFGTGTANGNVLDGFTAGATAPVNVTIDASNNTLAGLASAINAKNAGLSASIVNDGTSARLVIKGPTGADQAFTATATAASGATAATGDLARFNFGSATSGVVLQDEAKNSITVVDGITVTRKTNKLSDVIDGVTLDLVKTSDTAVNISAVRPTDAISTAVSDFVSAYNELQTILTEQADPKTGVLSGDQSTRQMRQMLSKLTSTPLRADGSPRTLAEIGVSTNRDGTLSLDTTKLTTALTTYPAEIEAMFNPAQTSSTALLKITQSKGVAAGTYTVTDVTAPKSGSFATTSRPDLFGTTDAPAPLEVPAGGWALKVGVDGSTAQTVTIPAGSYADGASLASAVQDAIEAQSLISGIVAVTWNGDHLVTTSALAGKSSAVVMTTADSDAQTALGINTGTATGGQDAAGTINGKVATSSGTRLFASQDSGVYGLVLQPSADVASATITVDLGLSAALDQITNALTGTDGGLYTANERLTKLQTDLTAQQTKVDTDADALETRLTKQFSTMDTRVAVYKQTQAFLTQQIDAWNNSNSN